MTTIMERRSRGRAPSIDAAPAAPALRDGWREPAGGTGPASRLLVASSAAGLVGGVASAALGWFLAMAAGFGGARAAAAGQETTALLGLVLLVGGGSGMAGAILAVRRHPRAGAYLQLLSGGACATLASVVGSLLWAVPGLLLVGAGVLTLLPTAGAGARSVASAGAPGAEGWR